LDRLYVRGLENVHKKFLIQAAACNLALLMRSTYGSGKPRATHDRAAEAMLIILAVINAVEDLCALTSAHFGIRLGFSPIRRPLPSFFTSRKSWGLDTGW